VLAVGWTGQWEAEFERSAEGVAVVAGMEKTRFILYPGESVRTPSFTVMPWGGTEEDSYNLWRSHMLGHHTPKDENGEIVKLPVTCGAWGGDSISAHKSTITFIKNQGYDYDAYWVDAGWFGKAERHSTDQYGDAWFKNAGDWYHNTTLYPNGLKEVSDAAHAAGMDFLGKSLFFCCRYDCQFVFYLNGSLCVISTEVARQRLGYACSYWCNAL